jgi:peptidoglycan hydrolase CwlO-like protein
VFSLVVYYKQQDNGIDEFEDSYREIDDKIEALRNRIDEINKKKAKH